MPLLIEKMLVASTGHITLDENVCLDRWNDFDEALGDFVAALAPTPVYVVNMGTGSGWLIGIISGNTEDSYPQLGFDCLPANLQALCKLAVQNDCCFLWLDPDGPLIESLPTFDW